MNLRRGVPADIPVLDAIAIAAKAHWGYSAQQLEAWRTDLSVAAETLKVRPVCVAEEHNQVVAFVQVATDVHPWELWAMWVLPASMGRGVGTALLAWATEFAASHGQSEIAIDSDPNAEGFYKVRGALVVGRVAAPIPGNPQRVRPQMRLPTSAA